MKRLARIVAARTATTGVGGTASRLRRAAACMIAAACLAAGPSGADIRESNLIPLRAFPREPIVVETRSARRYELDAWRADTPQTREQGLMFVREMGAEQAMIFVYDPPAYVSMWMKNTVLPLDMLFVNRYGCVVKVQREATPESLTTISAGAPVALVVELKGGAAATLGIGTGDRVLRPTAGWPAELKTCTGGN
jgi:uncharacterized membrane protein (UPF0127 family)